MFENSDMFKKIKSIFVVEDPNAATVSNDLPNNVESKPNDVSATSANNNLESTVTSSSGAPDQKFTDLLLKAIESNNLNGFDYLEFKNSLKSLEKVIPDEGMRYKSAFEMAKTMGLSKENLIQSAEKYLGILKTEDNKFKEALQNQKTKQVQGRTDQLAQIEKAILDKQSMIDKLNKEIEDDKAQFASVKNEINEAASKIDLTNQQFVASYNLVFNQINHDIQKIKTNL